MEKCIKEQKISGILFPGDGFNYDAHPYHPQPKARPRYSKILVEIAKEQGIPLVGACGGLQAVMYSEGINLKRVSSMVGHDHAKNHTLSETHTNLSNVDFLAQNCREQEVIEGTKLYSFLKKAEANAGINNDGKPYFMNPEAHGGAIDLDPTNINKLKEKGYKISARSPDKIIQGVEHAKYNITLFQGHPEALAAKKHATSVNLFKHFLINPAIELHNKNYVHEKHNGDMKQFEGEFMRKIMEAENERKEGPELH